MASRQSKKKESLFIPKPPQFFKVILQDAVQKGRLMIPEKFTRKYGSDIPSSVVLKVPTGAIWRVGVTKCDGGIWLQRGWREFMNYYSIVYGHFLVFKYVETSMFNVTIFDPTAVEIEYPYDTQEYEDDESVVILEDISTSSKRKGKSPVLYRKLKRDDSEEETMMKNSIRNEEFDTQEYEDDESVVILEDISTSSKRKGKSPVLSRKVKRDDSEEETMMKKLRGSFKQRKVKVETNIKSRLRVSGSSNPSYSENVKANVITNLFFKKVLPPSFLHSPLSVPFKFFEKFTQTKEQNGRLQMADRLWNVKLILNSINRRGHLSGGWFIFARDNKLKAGDECTLEIVDVKDPLFKVSVLKKQKPDSDQSTNLFET
ncbi:hypothetical protein ACFE04_009876 [Oxalis oulophora]